VRVTAHVVDVDLVFELAGKAVERLVGAFLGRPCAAPVEELLERQPEALVFLAGTLGIRIETSEQTGKPDGLDHRDRNLIVPRRRVRPCGMENRRWRGRAHACQ
jgi:hypothetical protein